MFLQLSYTTKMPSNPSQHHGDSRQRIGDSEQNLGCFSQKLGYFGQLRTINYW